MKIVACGVVAGVSASVLAGTITFEGAGVATHAGGTSSPGSYTTLSLADGDGVTATFTRLGSVSRFDVWDLSAFGRPAGWGNNSLDPFFAQGGGGDMFLVDFAAPGRIITGVSIEYGDYGQDSGDVRFQAFSGTGGVGLLSDQTQSWAGNIGAGSAPGTFSFGAASILSIKFWGELGGFPNSLFWDNLTITSSPESVIPLPTAGAMAMAGLGLVAARRRRA